MEKISQLFQNQKADTDGVDDDINDAVESLSIKTPLARGFRATRAEATQAKAKYPAWTIKVAIGSCAHIACRSAHFCKILKPYEQGVMLSSQAGLLLFSIVFLGLVLVGSTFFSAESARLADEGVLHSIHQQVTYFL
jgi:hypothetical protein